MTLAELLVLDQTDSDQFVTLATATLLSGVDHDRLRLQLVRRLTEHGLLGAARRFAESASDALRRQPGFAALLSSLVAGGDAGLIPCAKLAPQFDSNLRAIAVRYDWANELRRAWTDEHSQVEFHRRRDGSWQVFSARAAGGGWKPAFGPNTPRDGLNTLRRSSFGRVIPATVIEGMGLGFQTRAWFDATQRTLLTSSPVIYQVENSWIALAVALHLADWQGIIADERFRLCCGPRAHEQLRQWIESDAWTLIPQTLVRVPSWNPIENGGVEPQLRALATRVEQRRLESRAALSQRYSSRDAHWWARRFEHALIGGGPPLRVLGVTSRFTTVLQYTIRDALAAFERLGCRARLIIEPADHNLAPPQRTIDALREFDPDLILLPDHTRATQSASLVDGVPVLCWVQDRLPWLFSAQSGARLGPLDFFMGIGREELVRLYGYPSHRFFSTEMPTNPDALCDAPDAWPPGRVVPEFACDIAFATNWSQAPAQIHAVYRTNLDGAARGLVDACYDELTRRADRGQLSGGLFFEQFVARIAATTELRLSADQISPLVAEFAKPLVDALVRQQTIEWAARWAERGGGTLHLYGNGWEQHPRFSRYARGFLAHGERLGAAFRSAKINLHAGCNPATHQRVLDGLAAGGFFLFRRHPHDVSFGVSQAAYDAWKSRGMNVPHTMTTGDLPPPFDALRRELCALTGIDADAPFELSACDRERFVALHDDRTVFVADGIWPEFERLTFRSEEEFVQRVESCLSRPEERAAIAQSMRGRVISTFTYESLMRRVLEWLRTTLARQATPGAPAELPCPNRDRKEARGASERAGNRVPSRALAP
ncbi:MAG: glycosyltransferase [Phycisphaerae bacterium]